MTAGEIVTVLEKTDVNWWKVGDTVKSGYVPSSYLEELTDAQADAFTTSRDNPDVGGGSGANPFGASPSNTNPFGSTLAFVPPSNDESASNFDWGEPTSRKAADFSSFSLEPKAKSIRKVRSVRSDNSYLGSVCELSSGLVAKRG
jgi:uncharacterized protein YgiM (DUF1202 family)